MHRLDISPFVQAGIVRAARPEDSGRIGLRRYEEVFRAAKQHPEPLMEFCLGWLRRHPPDSKGREAPIVWDSGQFHHQHGRITAVLDLELAHIGDPMMDLAGWRIRDTVLGYGDFALLYDNYAALTGAPVDLDAIRIHLIAFTLTNQLAFAAALRNPPPESDLMMNLRWCGETNLFATEALAEYLDIELPRWIRRRRATRRAAPGTSISSGRCGCSRPTTNSCAIGHGWRFACPAICSGTTRSVRPWQTPTSTTCTDFSANGRQRGRTVRLSWSASCWPTPIRAVMTRALIRLLHRRNLRAQMLLGPPGSAMTRHIPMQRFPRP